MIEQPRDWIDYLSAFSGLAGALLAAFAIVYAVVQSSSTKRALIAERRAEFELGLLSEMRRQMSTTQFQHLAGYVGPLVVHPADETDLPLLRAVIGVKNGSLGARRLTELTNKATSEGKDRQSLLLEEAMGEVDSAIRRRLEG